MNQDFYLGAVQELCLSVSMLSEIERIASRDKGFDTGTAMHISSAFEKLVLERLQNAYNLPPARGRQAIASLENAIRGTGNA